MNRYMWLFAVLILIFIASIIAISAKMQSRREKAALGEETLSADDFDILEN